MENNKTKQVIYKNSGIDILNLSNRTYNLLMRNNYRTIQKFMSLDKKKLNETRSFGKISICEILQKQIEVKRSFNILPNNKKDDLDNIFLNKDLESSFLFDKIFLPKRAVLILKKKI